MVAAYPPPPTGSSPIRGLSDLHVHCAPDVFGRSLTDIQVAQFYRDRQMKAFAIKGHTAVTADRAWLVRSSVAGITAFGGIVQSLRAEGIGAEAIQMMGREVPGRLLQG